MQTWSTKRATIGQSPRQEFKSVKRRLKNDPNRRRVTVKKKDGTCVIVQPLQRFNGKQNVVRNIRSLKKLRTRVQKHMENLDRQIVEQELKQGQTIMKKVRELKQLYSQWIDPQLMIDQQFLTLQKIYPWSIKC